MNQITDQITELRQNYNDLGEDLILLEPVIAALQRGYELPEDYVASGLGRVVDYIRQHAKEVQDLSQFLQKSALQ